MKLQCIIPQYINQLVFVVLKQHQHLDHSHHIALHYTPFCCSKATLTLLPITCITQIFLFHHIHTISFSYFLLVPSSHHTTLHSFFYSFTLLSCLIFLSHHVTPFPPSSSSILPITSCYALSNLFLVHSSHPITLRSF